MDYLTVYSQVGKSSRQFFRLPVIKKIVCFFYEGNNKRSGKSEIVSDFYTFLVVYVCVSVLVVCDSKQQKYSEDSISLSIYN